MIIQIYNKLKINFILSNYKFQRTKFQKKIIIFQKNIFFDKERIHNFFYKKNILYSDIINTEVVLFPLLKVKDQYFIYSQNYFYKNWSK